MSRSLSIEKRFERVTRSGTFANVVRAAGLARCSVLDIGCSYGEHLAHFGKGSVGITIAPAESDYGRERGLDVRCANIESESFVLEQQFDAVFCNNLFEHLLSPHQFLIRIKRFIKPGGTLVLGVPCVPWLTPFIRLSKFGGSMASNHINFFTRATLVRTVIRAGWTVKTIRGFHFESALIDRLLDPVYPHFYIIASPIHDYQYPPKRQRELAGYTDTL
jgi:SAM-dependent methyltransferase